MNDLFGGLVFLEGKRLLPYSQGLGAIPVPGFLELKPNDNKDLFRKKGGLPGKYVKKERNSHFLDIWEG